MPRYHQQHPRDSFHGSHPNGTQTTRDNGTASPSTLALHFMPIGIHPNSCGSLACAAKNHLAGRAGHGVGPALGRRSRGGVIGANDHLESRQ